MFKNGDLLTNRYQLQQRLGHTAMGRQTWLAVDVQTEESITVKLLAFNPEMKWEELKLFAREGEILQSLNHAQIPKYRDYFEIDKEQGDGVYWFALIQDYIPGDSLQDLLNEDKTFTEIEVRQIAKEVLKILIYLHGLIPPVLHRDIKPSNLILGKNKKIYLVDFGAVQAQASVTGVTFTVVGSSGYAPLEQFWGKPVPASDLYALGATLIHLLTGVSPVDLPHRESQIEFASLVTVKPELQEWLTQMTDLILEKRFSSAREALDCLNNRRKSSAITTQNAVFGDFTKPARSRISFNRKRDKLEIHFPSNWDWNFRSIPNLIVLISLIVILPLAPIFAIIFIAIGIRSTQTLHLIWDRENLSIRKGFLNLTYRHLEYTNSDIIGVFLHSSQQGYQIRLRTKKDFHLLGSALTEEECLWLADEIQNWLNFVKNK